MSRTKKVIIILAIVFALLIGAAAYAIYYVRSAIETPPVVNEDPTRPVNTPTLRPGVSAPTPQPSQAPESPVSSGAAPVRDLTKFTFLLLIYGEHDGNTDVIMVVTFDTTNHKLEIVNIPRDTLVNVSWDLKKANSVYAHTRLNYRDQADVDTKTMQDTAAVFADILGYEVDFWVQLNFRAFRNLINAIDGVDFYVPVNMNYDDIAGGLSIHYSRGWHRLYGQQALEVLRFRSGYASADIGRIDTQQSFLKAAAEQILARRSSINVIELANVFIGNVKTDMDLKDLIWFGNEFLRMESENINFYTMPGNTIDFVGYESYVTIYLDEWLELVNSKLSPLYEDITPEGVSILTRGADRYLYVTDGNRQGDPNWGLYSRGADPNQVYWDSGPQGSSSGGPSGGSSGEPGRGSDDDSDVDPDDEDAEPPDGEPGDTESSPEDTPPEGYEELPSEEIAPLDEDPYEWPDNEPESGDEQP